MARSCTVRDVEQAARIFYNVRFFDADWNEIEELAALDQPMAAASILVGEFLVTKSGRVNDATLMTCALSRACECTLEVCIG